MTGKWLFWIKDPLEKKTAIIVCLYQQRLYDVLAFMKMLN